MNRLEKCELATKLGFKYSSVTGDIINPTGTISKKVSNNGYRMLTLRGFDKKAHYLYGHQFAWYSMYGEIVECIDHINQIKTDNRGLNLRSVNKSENGMNVKTVKGYSFCKRSNKYESYIMLNNKKTHLGYFSTELEARNKYLESKKTYHIINN